MAFMQIWSTPNLISDPFGRVNSPRETWRNMGVSKNRGVYPPKSSILIGFSLIFTIHFGFFPPIFGLTPTWRFHLLRNIDSIPKLPTPHRWGEDDFAKMFQWVRSRKRIQRTTRARFDIIGFLRVPGCPRGGGNWGTLRIPFGKIGEA